MLVFVNLDGPGRGGPRVWTERFRRELLRRGYETTLDRGDDWRAALFVADSEGLDRQMLQRGVVGYRVAGGYYPAWFDAMGRTMKPEHHRTNATIARGLELADVVFYQSRWAKDQLDDNLHRRIERFAIVPNGVDLESFSPAAAQRQREGAFVIGSVGVLRYAYRLECLFELSKRLDAPHRLLVVGSLDEEASAVMSRYREDHEIGPRLDYEPYVSPEHLPDIYRRMSLLVHPVSGDACPNVVVEALACGVPVVAPRHGGTSELIKDGGVIFEAEPWRYDDDFVDAMVDATRVVIDHREELSRRARLRAEGALAIGPMVDRYLEMLGLQPYAHESERRARKTLRGRALEEVRRRRAFVTRAWARALQPFAKTTGRPAKSKPRVAFTLYDFRVGGIESWLYRLADALREDFEFHFLATTVPEILPRFQKVGMCAFLRSASEMCSYLVRHRIDIVQVHNQRWPIDAALAAGVPHIVERTDGTRSCTRVHKSGLSLVIASSQGTAPMIARHFPTARIRVIENGIDLHHVDRLPRRRPWPEDRFVVGRVSRFGRGKNLGMLIEAGVRLKTRLPELKIVLIGGDSDMPDAEPIEAELREQALPLGDTVELRGVIDEPLELVKGFDVATCVSNPTNEGIPNSLLEAMSCRVPVVSTAVDQVPELVEDTVNGILISPGDVTALCEAIERLHREPSLRHRLAEAGRRTVEERFSLERAAGSYAAVYRELLEQN